MKSIFKLLTTSFVLLMLFGCAVKQPLPEVKHITTTEYIVIEVPVSYLTPVKPSPPTNTGCVGVIDWRECAISRAKTIVELYGNIGQCNSDKFQAREYIKKQTSIVNERVKKP